MSNLHHYYRINILSVLLCMLIIMMFRDRVWSCLGTIAKIRSKFTSVFSPIWWSKVVKNWQIVLVHLKSGLFWPCGGYLLYYKRGMIKYVDCLCSFDPNIWLLIKNNLSRLMTKSTKWLCVRPLWSESSLCAQWVAKDLSFLHAQNASAQSDLSLRWAHMPSCWFRHEAAHRCLSEMTSQVSYHEAWEEDRNRTPGEVFYSILQIISKNGQKSLKYNI